MKKNHIYQIILYAVVCCFCLHTHLSAKENLIPEGTTHIKDDAFYGNETLTSIIIPEGVVSIGKRAFNNCPNLKSVTIPSSLTSIGEDAFSRCTGLELISLENSKLTSILEGTFAGCKKLTSIKLPSTLTYIGKFAFSDCENLSSINFSENLEKIDRYALRWCNLKEIVLPDKVKFIEEDAFQGNPELSKISIGSSLEKIGGWAFFLCPMISEYQVSPDNTHFLAENGILYSKNKNTLVLYPPKHPLSTFKLPDETRVIGKNAFSENDNLTILDVNQATNFEGQENLFWDCPALEKFQTAPNNPNFVALNGVLYSRKMDQLIVYPMGKKDASFSIEEGVQSILRFAFYYNQNLTSITIPASVKSIQRFILSGCYQIKEVQVKCTTPPVMDTDLGISTGPTDPYYDTPIYIPKGTLNAYRAAEGWKYHKNFLEKEYSALQPEINDPSEHSLTVSWPSIPEATSYTVIVYADATKKDTIASYKFDAEGTLLRSSTSFSCVIDKLEAGTTYYIETLAYQEKDGEKTLLASTTIEGKTTGDAVANEMVNAEQPSCFTRNGQLYLLVPKTTDVYVYTLSGICVWHNTIQGEKTIALAKGTYLVRIGKISYKIIL